MADFFISHTSADKSWAEWIAYVLEEEDMKVIIQAWDFRPGSNFVLEMQRAATEADRTIMVLSPDYLKSQFASSEWTAALAVDPQGLQRKLLPIVVRQCQPQGLLSAVVHIDLVREGESEARRLLLDGVSAGRAKPAKRPFFPGTSSPRRRKAFPGQASSAAAVAYVPNLKRKPTDADRRRYSKNAFDVIKTYVQNGLDQLVHHNNNIECDFQANTAAEFTAEVFLSGKSAAQCRVWLGGMLSSDGISYAEGQRHYGSGACNEILSVRDDRDELYLSSVIGSGFVRLELPFDLKQMNAEQAAEYLWRRFVSTLKP
jgi:hypothetical protein